MKKSYIIIGIIVALVLLLGFNGCNTYNSMVTLGENVDKSWAQVENQYQRRLDLIPNLVNTVKGYAEHESSTLESVTKARAGLSDAYNSAEQLKNGASPADAQQFENYVAAQDRLKSAFDIYVNAVREAYPDLKANQNFIDLQTQLEGTENRIATERGRYTEAVQAYNVKVKRFPANLWAGMFGFAAKPQFKADAAAATAPKVEF